MGMTLHLHKLEFPLPYDALCQVWLKLDKWLYRGWFLNIVDAFLVCQNYLHLEKDKAFNWRNLNSFNRECGMPSYFLAFKKGLTLNLNKLEFPIRKAALCQVWLKLKCFWRKRWKCRKFTDRWKDQWTDRPTTDGQQAFRKAYSIISLRWANKRPMGHNAHLRKLFESINTWLSQCWLRGEKTHYLLYEN